MSKFASGKRSYFISDRSGQRYPYRQLKKEWTGAVVGPDEWEPKHPQLYPPRNVSDPQALRDARPDTNNLMSYTQEFPVFNLETLQYENNPIGTGRVGQVTVVTS
jgi:hypothetical protein